MKTDTPLPFSPSGDTRPKAEATPWETPDAKPDLLEPHFRDVYNAYKTNPGPETAGPLLNTLRPVIDESLRSYGGTEASTATARARAKIMALDAVNRYDPNRAKLRTHLLSHLRGLRRTVARSTAGVYMPEQWRIDSHRVEAATNDARDELGREPSDAEIADRTSLPLGRVRRARAAPGILAGSQFDNAFEFNTPSVQAYQRWLDTIYHDVDAKDQVIMDHSLGLHGRDVLPANQIATMLGVSNGAISQRRLKLQKMIDQYDSFMGTRG